VQASVDPTALRLQLGVFSLVAAAFTNIYLTQPVLPVLQREFGVDLVQVSLTVSAVILGIALANLPIGIVADRIPVRPIILAGGILLACFGLLCAMTDSFSLLLFSRFCQGAMIPCLTTCVAAYLARSLEPARLNVVLGSYVSATVLGGLGGRLLGGWSLHFMSWRVGFVAAAILTLFATGFALRLLPRGAQGEMQGRREEERVGFLQLLGRWDVMRILLCVGGGFAVFSSIFNFLPYRLTGEPFGLRTESITLVYLVYVVGIFMGPVAGKASNQLGSGRTFLLGTLVFATALLCISMPFVRAVIAGLLALCGGFFTIHAAAVGALNRRLSSGQGRANALYVLFYYLGGWLGITVSGLIYSWYGWGGFILFCLVLLLIPLLVGLAEQRLGDKSSLSSGSAKG
jgi:YNFM family putative membrane transporter